MPPPQKKYYRQRAHSNPIADHCFDYPSHPDKMDWNRHYPTFFEASSIDCSERDKTSNDRKEGEEVTATTTTTLVSTHSPPSPLLSTKNRVEFLDVGCGYGGLLVELSPLFPDTLMLGMEIRVKVSDYVQDRIKALRKDNPGQYENVACIRSNAMKYLPNFFHKSQLSKMFFLFPDPHFKKAKHKWRIINPHLLSEYAYVLKIGAIVYTITDVTDLHEWMVKHFTEHPLFRRLEREELVEDIVVEKIRESTEEGKKVTRNNGEKYMAVFQRVRDPFT